MKKHVVTGPVRCLSQCHPTITNSYSCQMFLLIHFEIQELWVIKTTNAQTQPENFQEILQIFRRFLGFPGVLDTLSVGLWCLCRSSVWCGVGQQSTEFCITQSKSNKLWQCWWRESSDDLYNDVWWHCQHVETINAWSWPNTALYYWPPYHQVHKYKL